jgi:DNA-binding transcriptional MerR regulator
MKNDELEKHAGREDLRLDEMLDIVNRLMEVVAPVQPSERVSETLSERNLRYYISQGLVDRPSGKEGTSALYSYRHLLQLLALKRLQASYLPVRKVREIIPNSTNEELEGIILGGPPVAGPVPGAPARDSAMAYLDSILPGGAKLRSSEHPGPCSPTPGPTTQPQPSASPGGSISPPASQSWERLVLDDGIELHIRTDRRESLRRSEVRRLFDRLLKIFRS